MYRNSGVKSTKHDMEPHLTNDNDFQQVIDETKQIRNESLLATRDALSRIRHTEATGEKTLTQLDSQSEKLHHAKTDLDIAKAQHKVATENIDELKRLNKWIAFKNPFKSSNAEKKLAEAKAKANMEERMRDDDETRKSRHESKRRVDNTRRAAANSPSSLRPLDQNHSSKLHSDLLDEQDRKAEDEIDSNLDEIGGIAARLKLMAQGMSEEVDQQNNLIDKLGKNADDMNVRVGLASAKVLKF